MKLNVGSGHPKERYKEWINIDSAPEGTFDETYAKALSMSVFDMPFDEWQNKFEEIHCIHVLEHINRNLRSKVLESLYKVTAPGGTLYLEVPNFQDIIDRLHQAYLHDDQVSIHKWKTSIYGKQRYDGDAHHWGYDAIHLSELARNAGFSIVETTSDPNRMVSSHYKQEPVILLIATK